MLYIILYFPPYFEDISKSSASRVAIEKSEDIMINNLVYMTCLSSLQRLLGNVW